MHVLAPGRHKLLTVVRGAALAAILAAVWLGAVGAARAGGLELSEEEAQRVTVLVAEAQELREAGDFAGAVMKLRSAIAIYPAASLYYNLGRLYEEANELTLAQHQYRLCLDKAPEEDVREVATAGLTRVQARLARGALRIEGLPAGASVLVDDEPRGEAPLAPLALPVGRHLVVVRMEGFFEHETTVEVPSDGEAILSVALQPIPAVGPRAEAESGSLFHLGVLIGEGLAVYDEEVYRSKVSLELLPSFHIAWFRADLAVTVLVEPEMAVILRPGARFAGGMFYSRVAFQAVVTPVLTTGLLLGAGMELELGKSWSLMAELDISLWFEALAVVPLEARLGVSYGF